MALPLIDFRGKITHEAHAVLSARSQRTGLDMQELARKVLHEWALDVLDENKLIQKKLSVAGFEGIRGEGRAK